MLHRSTYGSLLTKEVNDEIELRRQLDVVIEEKVGLKLLAKDFREMGLEETPTFEKYEDYIVERTPDEPPEEL